MERSSGREAARASSRSRTLGDQVDRESRTMESKCSQNDGTRWSASCSPKTAVMALERTLSLGQTRITWTSRSTMDLTSSSHSSL